MSFSILRPISARNILTGIFLEIKGLINSRFRGLLFSL
jgi:hypothetical protein